MTRPLRLPALLDPAAPPRARLLAGAALWLAAALVLLWAVSTLLEGGDHGEGRDLHTDVLYPLLYLPAAAICFARALCLRAERLPWLLIGAAPALWCGGYTVYNNVVRHLDPVPYPAISDAFWVAAYVVL